MHEWTTYSLHNTQHFHLMREMPPNQRQCQKHLLHIYLLKCLMNIWKAFSNHKTSFKLSPSFLLWIINHILKRLLQFLHLLSSYGEWVRKQFAWWRPVKTERERKYSDSLDCIQEKKIILRFSCVLHVSVFEFCIPFEQLLFPPLKMLKSFNVKAPRGVIPRRSWHLELKNYFRVGDEVWLNSLTSI